MGGANNPGFSTNNAPLRGDWLMLDIGLFAATLYLCRMIGSWRMLVFIQQTMYVCLLYMEDVERIERLLNCISPRRGALLVAQDSQPMPLLTP